jgi:hypothetical protein
MHSHTHSNTHSYTQVIAASALVDGCGTALAAQSAHSTRDSGSRGDQVVMTGGGGESVDSLAVTIVEGGLPEADAPVAFISSLRGFQRQGLGWMQAREAEGTEASGVGVGAGFEPRSQGGNVPSESALHAPASEKTEGDGGLGQGAREGTGCVDVAAHDGLVESGPLHPLWSEWHVPVYNGSDAHAYTNASTAGSSVCGVTAVRRIFLKAIEGELRLEAPAACRPVRGGILAGPPLGPPLR